MQESFNRIVNSLSKPSRAVYICHMTALKALISQGESQHLEFKFELNSARRISETLSAFANTSGGTLLIGVKDNGAIAGVRLEEELYVLEAAAEMYCFPPIQLHFKRNEIEGKVILEARVEESNQKPVLSEFEPDVKRAFVRIGASNRTASPVHLKLWEFKDPQASPPSEYTATEQQILGLFIQKKWLTLNQTCRITKLPRHKVIVCFANFIRWGILLCEPEAAGGFVFTLTEEFN